MRRAAKLSRGAAYLFLGSLLLACSALLGLPDPALDDTLASDDASRDTVRDAVATDALREAAAKDAASDARDATFCDEKMHTLCADFDQGGASLARWSQSASGRSSVEIRSGEAVSRPFAAFFHAEAPGGGIAGEVSLSTLMVSPSRRATLTYDLFVQPTALEGQRINFATFGYGGGTSVVLAYVRSGSMMTTTLVVPGREPLACAAVALEKWTHFEWTWTVTTAQPSDSIALKINGSESCNAGILQPARAGKWQLQVGAQVSTATGALWDEYVDNVIVDIE